MRRPRATTRCLPRRVCSCREAPGWRGVHRALGIAAVLGSLLAAPVTHAAYTGENGRIAFQRSTSSFSTSIYTMNPDGSDVAVLPGTTEANVHYRDPAWTPDGNRIGFVRS